MRDIAQSIQSILQVRRGALVAAANHADNWKTVAKLSSGMGDALALLGEDPGLSTGVSGRLLSRRADLTALVPRIQDLIDRLDVLTARFGRETVNIGVSGNARVGKSTLLQSIAGLSDDQVPTGEGLPVTAVRSRIFNTEATPGATLALHTYETFRQEVLLPYYEILGLGEPPSILEQFKDLTYPASADDLTDRAGERHTRDVQLGRLRDIQAAVWSYEDLLRGPVRELRVSLEDLRQYVAYPTREEEEESGGRPSRLYLAVREARIECHFPYSPVYKLGLIDLPGMGEVDPRADRRHVASLRNEVDVVLLIKRPVEGGAYWGAPDAALVDLLDEARGDLIADRRDFALIVINDDGESPVRLKALRHAIADKVNSGPGRDRLTVLETNAVSPESAADGVLNPVLSHLGERLPLMDRQLYEGTLQESAVMTVELRSLLACVAEDLIAVRHAVGSKDESLTAQADELHKDIAVALGAIVGRLRRQAREAAEDTDYLAAVQDAYESVTAWVRSGLGYGEEAWCRNALRSMIRSGGSQGFAEEEFSRVRVEVSSRFAIIDDFFKRRISELWAEVAGVFSESLGMMLPDPGSDDALERLKLIVTSADDPCPVIRRAIYDLLDVHLEYRYQLAPHVRAELDVLQLQQPDAGMTDGNVQIAVPVSETGAAELYRFIVGRAEQAAFLVRGALLAEEVSSAKIFHAVIEQFDDAVIRSEHSKAEFRGLARSYAAEIWPSLYGRQEGTRALIAQAVEASDAMTASLTEIESEVA